MEIKARPLRADVPAFVLDIVDRATAAGIPKARKQILQAFENLVAGIRIGDLAEAIEAGNSAIIFARTEPWLKFVSDLEDVFDPRGEFGRVMDQVAERSVRLIPDAPSIDLEAVGARARAWLENHGSRLVVLIDDHTRQGITAIVQDAFAAPRGLREASREIARLRGLGLTRQGQQSLAKYGAQLRAQKEPALSSKRIEDLLRRRHGRLLRQRARTIAQTEAYNAGAQAQTALWEEATLAGELDSGVYVQEWVTRVINVCPRCQALDGVTAELPGGLFVSRVIEDGSFAGQTIAVEAPTVHPRCYCTRRIIRRDQALALAA